MTVDSDSLGYWERNIPWTFKDEKLTYGERRKLRYDLQDYMAGAIGFDNHKSQLVLEIGSGNGIDSAEFYRHGAEVVSLDFTATGTRTTQETLLEAGFNPRVLRAAAGHLPFRNSTFNCVYSFGVIHHIPNATEVIREVARVLKPGGELICMLYNRNSLLYAYSILFLHKGEAPEDEILRKYSERVLDSPYTRAYTKSEAVQLLSGAFDTIVEVHYNVIDLPLKRKIKLGLPDEYELGWHLIVKGKRRT